MPGSVTARPESPVGIRLRTIQSKSGMRAREVADLVGATPQTCLDGNEVELSRSPPI